MCKARPLNLGKFTQLLSAYRACVLELPNRDPLIEARLRSTEPPFSKTITLDGGRIRIAYAGTKKGHRVANEFSLDHLSMLLSGATQTVDFGERQITVLRSDLSPQLRATVTLLNDCAFTDATVRAKPRKPAAPGKRDDPGPYRRLHRGSRLHRDREYG